MLEPDVALARLLPWHDFLHDQQHLLQRGQGSQPERARLNGGELLDRLREEVLGDKDAETAEREQGNKEFSAGQFPQAVKSYTKCLGLKKRNYIAFSNRAMAYLKKKCFMQAVDDADKAIEMDPGNLKAYHRRAKAYVGLGQHEDAIEDFQFLLDKEPENTEINTASSTAKKK